jgi:hypothetical protein
MLDLGLLVWLDVCCMWYPPPHPLKSPKVFEVKDLSLDLGLIVGNEKARLVPGFLVCSLRLIVAAVSTVDAGWDGSGLPFDVAGDEVGYGFGVFALGKVADAFEEDSFVGAGEKGSLIFGAFGQVGAVVAAV